MSYGVHPEPFISLLKNSECSDKNFKRLIRLNVFSEVPE
jgi:hypothetical protein